jgi:chromosome segregation ATPase
MSINVKKYTKDQMAKMVEDAQEKSTALEKEVVELKDCMNGEAINKANEIANLKADLDSAKNSAQCLNDQGQQYWRVWQASKREVADLKNKLNDTEAALGRANGECAFKQEALNVMRNRRYNAERRADYAEAHPWRNLWAWFKRKVARHE